MKKIIVSLIVLISVAGSLFAEGGLDFSADIQTIWGVATPWTSKVAWSDSDIAGRFLLGDTSFTGKLDAWYNNSSALVDTSVSYNAVTNALNFSLNELWLDYTSSFMGIRIGRQKIAWGKADGVDITNVICPKDISSFAAMVGDNSNLPVDSVRLSLLGNQFTADAYWIPFFNPTALPLNEGNSLRKFLVPANVEIPVQGMAEPLKIPVLIGALNKPEAAIWNGEYGLKMSGYFSAFDISLYGFYGWDDIPLLDYSIAFSTPTGSPPISLPQSITVSGEYKRMGMIGVDAALPIKEIVIRLEGAFFPQRYFQKSSEEIVKGKISAISAGEQTSATTFDQRNELSGLAGIDWMPSGWTITAQYFCDYVFGEIELLEREKSYTHGATLSVSKTFLSETLNASVSGLVNFNDLDSFISPSVNYKISDQISFETGAFIFLPGPERDGEYGKYKDLSSIYIKGKISL